VQSVIPLINDAQVTRYHPPQVRDALNELLVTKERLAATASSSWLSFLAKDFGVQHYAQLKVRTYMTGTSKNLYPFNSLSRQKGFYRDKIWKAPYSLCLLHFCSCRPANILYVHPYIAVL